MEISDEGGGQHEMIAFEAIDAEIFGIPDPKTRLNTLQQYFFPRLERHVKRLVEKVQDVYKIDPLEDMTFSYRPANRKDASIVKDYGEVHIGLTPKRTSEPLQVYHDDGSPFLFGPSLLAVVVNPTRGLRIAFRPYMYKVDVRFQDRMGVNLLLG